jgi:hypothetical protein
MLVPPVILGSIGIWRGWRYLRAEHRRVRALGVAEALQKESDQSGDD